MTLGHISNYRLDQAFYYLRGKLNWLTSYKQHLGHKRILYWLDAQKTQAFGVSRNTIIYTCKNANYSFLSTISWFCLANRREVAGTISISPTRYMNAWMEIFKIDLSDARSQQYLKDSGYFLFLLSGFLIKREAVGLFVPNANGWRSYWEHKQLEDVAIYVLIYVTLDESQSCKQNWVWQKVVWNSSHLISQYMDCISRHPGWQSPRMPP